jgi:hypothetical protein
MKKAIAEHCRGCMYDPESGLGNWKQQITQCHITKCALWPYRPISKPKKSGGGEIPAALKAYREKALANVEEQA